MTDLHVFAGYPQDVGPSIVAHLRVTPGGYSCGRLAHHVRHSPDGFAWGYDGSGPTELARCLLIATLGHFAVDEACGGEGCPACGGTGFDVDLVEMRYHQVRDRLVSPVPQDATVVATGDDVLIAAGLRERSR